MTAVLPRFNEIRAVIDRPYSCELRIRRFVGQSRSNQRERDDPASGPSPFARRTRGLKPATTSVRKRITELVVAGFSPPSRVHAVHASELDTPIREVYS